MMASARSTEAEDTLERVPRSLKTSTRWEAPMGEDLGRKLRNEAFLKAIEIDWWVPSQVPMNRLLALNRLWRKDYVKE